MRYSRDAFDALEEGEKSRRVNELARYLSERLVESNDFDQEVQRIVDSLREQGHDLWSWDESDDFELWGPDYQNNPTITGLLIYFKRPSVVEVVWQEGSDPSVARKVFGEGLR